MDERKHRFAKQDPVVAPVEAPLHFVELRGQMTRRKLTVAAADAALHEAPRALCGLRVDFAA